MTDLATVFSRRRLALVFLPLMETRCRQLCVVLWDGMRRTEQEHNPDAQWHGSQSWDHDSQHGTGARLHLNLA